MIFLILSKKRVQVTGNNLNSMDEVQNAHQAYVHFSTVILKIQLMKIRKKLYRRYYYVQRRKRHC